MTEAVIALIDSKKVYVRYISHELRTPLNAILLGLTILINDLKASDNPKDTERHDTLVDVKQACGIAVDILNDLLCFDKLESGILELHKHQVPVIPFIKDCVSMFSGQAKDAGIQCNILLNEEVSIDGVAPLFLSEDDTILMDKFKMDQVLRNLISNALKFTPRGGQVSINAEFKPNQDDPSTVIKRIDDTKGNKSSYGYIMSLFVDFISTFRSYRNHVKEFPADDLDLVRTITPSSSRYNLSTRNSQTNLYQLDEHDILESQPPPPCNKPSMIHGKLVLTVTDTGAGLTESNQAKLFNRIVQFNPEVLQAGGGSGLGLWITNNIIKLHEGTVSVFSRGEGQGCSFTIEIGMERSLSPLSEITRDINPSTSSCVPHSHSGRSDLGGEPGPGHGPCLDLDMDLSRPRHRPCLDTERDQHRPCLGMDRDLSREAGDGLKTLDADCTEESHNSAIDDEESAHSFLGKNNQNCTGEQSSSSTDVAFDNFKSEKTPALFLIVDDSHLNRKMLRKLVESQGHLSELAEDGIIAVEKVKTRKLGADSKKTQYDAILMDYTMPNMDGPTATRHIREMGYDGPIFGVTGNALQSDVNYFKKCGANEVLAKPLDIQLLNKHMEGAFITVEK
eukprot:CAMPEP_0119051260 /NCGR_PEP_ID=MMETSP1177-20130426/72933_1 /TAXON_ID=2985 /ORGANISM="Ochromonas sp, Strain CCMP1899" /LENGTH=620 /DNA_ID=CAMNT_0007030401 /DNA_START=1058 /DNA_END=2920 /DNA_ORIENTATION=-